MVLTPEQQERIRKNRERALEIQRKRKLEEQQQQQQKVKKSEIEDEKIGVTNSTEVNKDTKKQKINNDNSDNDNNNDNEILEEFEIGASEYVTKNEAMKVYCLPIGTLDTCTYVEKPNPINNKFSTMKLYNRTEIRKRAYKRYGGLNGLINERQIRNNKRIIKDLERTKDIFK